jgi:hypothetical protein
MAPKISASVIERSRGFLEPGERIERVLLAQGGVTPWAQVGFPLVGLIGVRTVAVAAGATGGVGALGGVLGALIGAVVAAEVTTRRVVLATDREVRRREADQGHRTAAAGHRDPGPVRYLGADRVGR